MEELIFAELKDTDIAWYIERFLAEMAREWHDDEVEVVDDGDYEFDEIAGSYCHESDLYAQV